MEMRNFRAVVALFAVATLSSPASAQRGATQAPGPDPLASIPRAIDMVGKPSSEMADFLNRYSADQTSLARRYDAPDSPLQRKRMREFYQGWRTRLTEGDFGKLKQEGRVGYVVL